MCKKDETHNKLNDKHIPPFKRFNYNRDCYFLPDDNKFTNDTHLELYPDCEYLHQLIYNKFIDYWNSTILREVKLSYDSTTRAPEPIRPSIPSDADARRERLAETLAMDCASACASATASACASATASAVAPATKKESEVRAETKPPRDLSEILSELGFTLEDKQYIFQNKDKLLAHLDKAERTVVMQWAAPQKKTAKGGSYRNKRLYKKGKITKRRAAYKKSRRLNYIKSKYIV
jgi:hypothetical protein